MTTILGIDPGSRVTGYGLIRYVEKKTIFIDCGVIRVKAQVLSQKLAHIFSGIQTLIEKYQPEEIAIEQVFFGKNASSALKLGQARGCALAAVANQQLPIFEYAPRQIKQAISGSGSADKAQIQHMVRLLLNLNQSPQADAADALAIALCHAHIHENSSKIRAALEKEKT